MVWESRSICGWSVYVATEAQEAWASRPPIIPQLSSLGIFVDPCTWPSPLPLKLMSCYQKNDCILWLLWIFPFYCGWKKLPTHLGKVPSHYLPCKWYPLTLDSATNTASLSDLLNLGSCKWRLPPPHTHSSKLFLYSTLLKFHAPVPFHLWLCIIFH